MRPPIAQIAQMLLGENALRARMARMDLSVRSVGAFELGRRSKMGRGLGLRIHSECAQPVRDQNNTT